MFLTSRLVKFEIFMTRTSHNGHLTSLWRLQKLRTCWINQGTGQCPANESFHILQHRESKRFGTAVGTHDFNILCACQRGRFREVSGQSTRSLEVWLAGQEHEVQFYHQRQESVLHVDAWTCFFGPKMNACNPMTRYMP